MAEEIVVLWGSGIEGLGGETRLLGQLLSALEKLGLSYRVFVPRVVKRDHIVEENIVKRLGSIIGFSMEYAGKRSARSVSVRVLFSAMKTLGKGDILLVRGLSFIEAFLSYLFKVFKGFELIVYTGVYGSHVFDLEAVKAYGLAFPNRVKKVKVLKSKQGLLGIPIYLANTVLSRLLRHLVVFSAFSEPLLLVFRKGMRRVALLYPVVDTRFFRFKRLVPYDEPVLSVVARVSPEKNIHLAVMLADKLSLLFKDLELIICGSVEDRAYYDYLSRLVSRSRSRVRMITNCSWKEARMVYWSSNVLLNFSEGAFGIVNVEALASGCVPVAHLELSNAVLPYGVVFRTPGEAMRRTVKLLQDPEELRWRSIKGSEYVHRKFSQEAFIENLKKLLEHIATT